jgi:phage gpG-like protein
MGHRRSRWAIGWAAAAVALTVGAPSLAATVVAGAHAASVLNVRDEGHLRFVHSSGSEIVDEGPVSGTFPGSVKARFVYDGEPQVSAQFTITGRDGSVSARGSGRLSSPTSPSPSFRGHMTITGGSGRYAHIHGGGELFGVYNRRSYALIVQAIAKLRY